MEDHMKKDVIYIYIEPQLRRCIVSLSKNINPSLVLVQPRKTCPFITENLLMGCKESNQTNNILGNTEPVSSVHMYSFYPVTSKGRHTFANRELPYQAAQAALVTYT